MMNTELLASLMEVQFCWLETQFLNLENKKSRFSSLWLVLEQAKVWSLSLEMEFNFKSFKLYELDQCQLYITNMAKSFLDLLMVC